MDWIDAGRGVSMVLVTIYHVMFVVGAVLGDHSGVWPVIDEALAPLRMPLFFFISGMLAERAVRRPLRLTRRRTIGLAYLYVLWSVIQLLHLLYSVRGRGDPFPESYDIVASFLFPTGLWFFWALGLYFLLSHFLIRWMGRWSRWGVIPLLGVAMLAPIVEDLTRGSVSTLFGSVFFGAVCANFVWFYAALHLRAAVVRLVEGASWAWTILAVSTFLLLTLLASAAGVTSEIRWLLSVSALLAAFLVLGRGRYQGRVAQSLVAVGRRTLPIYALQWVALHLLAKAIVETPWLSSLGPADLVSTVATPAFALVIVAVTWWVGGALLSSPLRWLFVAPTWMVGSTPSDRSSGIESPTKEPGRRRGWGDRARAVRRNRRKRL
ncbi:acyltransferase [Herbiconiux sp. L3-i23]|uniref:acyltransferase family protein n=1 Tax=Herbiconiux sp. L3-i23 TaxID=2905871 RepID=UPI002072D819|nr:acyltransferase [Herbiconiux sp. L3-i23]